VQAAMLREARVAAAEAAAKAAAEAALDATAMASVGASIDPATMEPPVLAAADSMLGPPTLAETGGATEVCAAAIASETYSAAAAAPASISEEGLRVDGAAVETVGGGTANADADVHGVDATPQEAPPREPDATEGEEALLVSESQHWQADADADADADTRGATIQTALLPEWAQTVAHAVRQVPEPPPPVHRRGGGASSDLLGDGANSAATGVASRVSDAREPELAPHTAPNAPVADGASLALAFLYGIHDVGAIRSGGRARIQPGSLSMTRTRPANSEA